MKIKHFYLALSTDDLLGNIVSDFNFQSDFMTHYIEGRLKKLKYDSNDFNLIMIRGRKQPKECFFIEEKYKSLTIEIPFIEEKYKELYSSTNVYPLEEFLNPVLKEKEFSDFLFKMIMEGLLKLKNQKASVPCDFLIETLSDFRLDGFSNEWIHKKKVCKDYGVIAYLKCRLTSNYFSLELIIEKSKKEIYKKEVLRTLPSVIMYKDEFKDIQVVKGKLLIMKNTSEESILFSLDLSSL